MDGHGIYTGRRTPALRQILARRSEFYFDEDHEAVLGLLRDNYGYIVYPSTLREQFGWPRHRAIRVLDEVADALGLSRGVVDSTHGKFGAWVFGEVVESKTWAVSVDERVPVEADLSYPPVSGQGHAPVHAHDPAPTPVPSPAPPTAWDGVCDAVKTVLAGTKVVKPEAARGLIRYGMTEHGLEPGEVADMLVDLSRAGRGATRAAIAERMTETSAPAVAEPEDRETPRVAEKRVALNELAARRPDLARTCAALGVVLDVRDVPVAEHFVETWDGQFQSVAGHFTERDALDAAGAVVARGGSKLDDMGSALAALTREAVAA